jgi:hypothetical protein
VRELKGQGAGDDADAPCLSPAPAGKCKLYSRLFLAKHVKFTISHTAEKRVPLVGGKAEDGTLDVFAVANTYDASRQVSDLDTVPVGIAERTLDPV